MSMLGDLRYLNESFRCITKVQHVSLGNFSHFLLHSGDFVGILTEIICLWQTTSLSNEMVYCSQ